MLTNSDIWQEISRTPNTMRPKLNNKISGKINSDKFKRAATQNHSENWQDTHPLANVNASLPTGKIAS